MTHSTLNQATLSKLLAANADSFQAKSGSCNNDMSEKQFKSVKEYRREIDNLFRQVNSHYHACRGLNEFESFAAQLKGVSDRVAGLACKRANSDDLASHARALYVAAECAAKVQDKINELSDLKAYFVKKRH